MQAVILAAGRGMRMGDLTSETPKPLLEVKGKTLLEYKLDVLPKSIDEVIFVIGYKRDKVREKIGNSYKGIPIKYVVQEELDGTAGALWCAKDLLHDRFLVMMGDDLYSREDIDKCLGNDRAILVDTREFPHGAHFTGGNVIMDKGGNLLRIGEGEHTNGHVRINAALYVLGSEFFDYKPIPKGSGSKEVGLPQTLVLTAQDIPVAVVEARGWAQITDKDDLKKAEEWVRKHAV